MIRSVMIGALLLGAAPSAQGAPTKAEVKAAIRQSRDALCADPIEVLGAAVPDAASYGRKVGSRALVGYVACVGLSAHSDTRAFAPAIVKAFDAAQRARALVRGSDVDALAAGESTLAAISGEVGLSAMETGFEPWSVEVVTAWAEHTDAPTAWFLVGSAAVAQEQFDDAATAYQRGAAASLAADELGTAADMKASQAAALQLAGRSDEAIAILEALLTESASLATERRVQILAQLADWSEGPTQLRALEAFLELVPDNPLARVALAQALSRAGKHVRAEAELQRVIAADPTMWNALFELGSLRLEAASIALKTAMEAPEAQAKAYGAQANAWLAESRGYLERAYAQAPREQALLFALVTVTGRLEDFAAFKRYKAELEALREPSP